MAQATDGVVRIPQEYAQHLSELAAARGTTESVLVEEALALLFCLNPEERAALRSQIGEHGASTLERMATLSPDDIAAAIPGPVYPRKLYREDDGC